MSRPDRRTSSKILTLLCAGVLVLAGVTPARAGDDPQPVDFTHNVRDAEAPVAGAVFGTGPATKTGTAICTTPTQATPQRQHRLRDQQHGSAQRDLDRGEPHRQPTT